MPINKQEKEMSMSQYPKQGKQIPGPIEDKHAKTHVHAEKAKLRDILGKAMGGKGMEGKSPKMSGKMC